ncbi:hypothetical protein OENI_60131 [Oenococcus oeni]|nr:hypothetical protein OENI_60131 [Oenococcus oeni]
MIQKQVLLSKYNGIPPLQNMNNGYFNHFVDTFVY